MTLLFSQLTSNWHHWNDQLEQLNTGIVSRAANCLPLPARRGIDKHLTQIQLTVHLLGISVLFLATFVNPLITSWITYPIGIAGIVATSGVTYRFLERHFPEPLKVFVSRISSFVFSSIFGRSSCDGSTDEDIHINTDDYRMHPLERAALNHCEQLIEEIRELKNILRNIRQFVVDRPRLNAICEQYIREHPEGIVQVRRPQLEGLDYNKIFDRQLILGLKRDAYAIELREIMLFIQRHSEVYACFREHIEIERARRERPVSETFLIEFPSNLEE
ncbi:MAG: hypothetical protein WAM28_03720 [Chlamydiales bacterium]